MASAEYQEFQKYFNQKKYRVAAELADKLHDQNNRKNGFWLTQKARALTALGQHEQAEVAAREALALEPGNGYALLALADVLAGLRQYNEARSYYQEVDQHQRVGHKARHGVLFCLAEQKLWEELLTQIHHYPLSFKEEKQWSVKANKALGRLDAALGDCNQWLEKDPDNPHALWELTELEILQKGLTAVLEKMKKLSRIPSRPPIYGEIYASLCRRAGKEDEAAAQYQKMSRKIHDPALQRKQAFAWAKSGKETEAIPVFEEFLRLDPVDKYLNSAYCAACSRAGMVEHGINFYTELLARFPEEKRIYGPLNRLKKRLPR